jgi:hypothetical protein
MGTPYKPPRRSVKSQIKFTKKSNMEQFLKRAMNAPAQKWEAIKALMDNTRHNIAFSQEDMDHIFAFYNAYIAHAWEKEDKNCGACRAKVVGILRTITKQ